MNTNAVRRSQLHPQVAMGVQVGVRVFAQVYQEVAHSAKKGGGQGAKDAMNQGASAVRTKLSQQMALEVRVCVGKRRGFIRRSSRTARLDSMLTSTAMDGMCSTTCHVHCTVRLCNCDTSQRRLANILIHVHQLLIAVTASAACASTASLPSLVCSSPCIRCNNTVQLRHRLTPTS